MFFDFGSFWSVLFDSFVLNFAQQLWAGVGDFLTGLFGG